MTRIIDAWPRLKRNKLPRADPALDYRPAVPSVLSQTDMLLLDCAGAAHMPDEPSRIIELTSPTLGEGTSTIARELALTIAGHLSKPVMLIRAVNDLPLSPGIEAVAHGRIPLEAVVETDPDVPTLTTATLMQPGDFVIEFLRLLAVRGRRQMMPRDVPEAVAHHRRHAG